MVPVSRSGVIMSSQMQANTFVCVCLLSCRCVWMQVCVDILLRGRWTSLWCLTEGARMEGGLGWWRMEGGSVFDWTANLSLLHPGDSGDHGTSHYSEPHPRFTFPSFLLPADHLTPFHEFPFFCLIRCVLLLRAA